jgi:signal transduction histidine kinase
VTDGDDETLVIVRNITDLVQSEARALQLRLEKERSAILAGFVQDVSHEFGNPLSVIKNDLYLIGHETDPDRKQRRLDSIGGQAFHIERLVKGLLMMTRLDHAGELVCEPLDLNDTVRMVMDGLASALRGKDHLYTLDLAAARPVVCADQRQLSQVISELARNAILFTPPGGQIALATRQQGDWAVIECRDSGIGISAEDLPHIFERFFRVDKARGERGAGLGLSIAQKIVAMHQGRIEVESTPGVGSTFQVFLPIQHT